MPPSLKRKAARPGPSRRTFVGPALMTSGLLLALAGLGLAVSAAADDAITSADGTPPAELAVPILGLFLTASGLGLAGWGWKLATGSAARRAARRRRRPTPGPGPEPSGSVEARVVGPETASTPPLTPELQHACGAWNEAGTAACRGCGQRLGR